MLKRIAIAFAASSALYVSNVYANTVCTVVADVNTGKILEQKGQCEQRVTPASTFKIAISLMGFDSGILKDEHSPVLPFREGYPDWLPIWRNDTDPTSWIKNSVVWYSQQITQKLGEKRFQQYVTAFHYGNEDASGDTGKHNGLTRAWLSSSLKISPLEQISFLTKIAKHQLPVTEHAYDMTNRVTAMSSLNGWSVHGKTGKGFPVNAAGSKDKDHAFGWFVGWANKGTQTVVFTRLIQDDKSESVSTGYRARDAQMAELPAILSTL